MADGRVVSITAPRVAAPTARPHPALRDVAIGAAVLIACALFIFVDGATMPIVRWDESRNMVNALEMRASGWSVVTTYGGQPDLWNTKPPLAIWAMTLSTRAFGATEWALRLPSLLATLATLTLVMAFVRRVSGTMIPAAGAAAMLALSPGFFGEHAARTADYDAPLIFFTTLCALALFDVLHGRRPRVALAIAAAAGAAALMTKGIAGAMPLAGVAVYAAAVGRARRLLRPRVLAAAAAAALPLATWLMLREAAGAGFAAATWRNDVGGRYARSLIGDAKPVGFYLQQLAAGYLAGLPLLLAAPLSWRLGARRRERLAIGFALCVAVTQLAIVSAAASKLSHYLLPALPFAAIAAALGTGALARRLPRWPVVALVAIVMIVAAERAGTIRYRLEPAGEWRGAGLYGSLLAALPPGEVAVWEPAAPIEDQQHYVPELAAYRLIWAERGIAARQVVREAEIGDAPLVASCDPAIVALLRQRGPDVAGVAGCVAIAR